MNREGRESESGIFISRLKNKNIWLRLWMRRRMKTALARKLIQASSHFDGALKQRNVTTCLKHRNLGCRKNPPCLNRISSREMTKKFVFILVCTQWKFSFVSPHVNRRSLSLSKFQEFVLVLIKLRLAVPHQDLLFHVFSSPG